MFKLYKLSHKQLILICIGIGLFVAALVAVILMLTLRHDASNNSSLEPEQVSGQPEFASESEPEPEPKVDQATPTVNSEPVYTGATSPGNCTTNWGRLMLINPVFIVSTDFIAARRAELIDITATYGIREGNYYNGTPLLDAEAAAHLNDMLNAYYAAYPGHEITTRSCFRSQGTSCGRLCYATGTSDHHTGYTCDLIDDAYGNSLDTDTYASHPEWQWLHDNSYRYGFIDRFVEHWAGGPMTEPVNINAEGSTGLYETWHYRYVGIDAATDIATGKYNGGVYDSLEHYLKATDRLPNLTSMASSCP